MLALVDSIFVPWPKVASHFPDGTLYADIINHYSGKLHYPDRMTDAHETSHMIHADIRNKNNLGFHGGGFYVGDDRACFMPQPKFRKSQVAAFIPENLRESRFRTYVVGMNEWDDSSLYLYDEWNAYINGGAVAVEQVDLGEQLSWTDAVMGLLEFSVYAVATVMACQNHDPSFLAGEPKFLEFTAFNLRRAATLFDAGSKMDEFKWDKQDEYLRRLRETTDAREIRETLAQQFSGVFLGPPLYGDIE